MRSKVYVPDTSGPMREQAAAQERANKAAEEAREKARELERQFQEKQMNSRINAQTDLNNPNTPQVVPGGEAAESDGGVISGFKRRKKGSGLSSQLGIEV